MCFFNLRRIFSYSLASLATVIISATLTANAAAEPQRAVALSRALEGAQFIQGDPLHGSDFQHFAWVNADAPKGGSLALCILEPEAESHTLRDFLRPANIGDRIDTHPGMLVFDTLMVRNPGEPGSWYGLIASSVDIAADGGSITFQINPAARFWGRAPIGSANVAQSLRLSIRSGLISPGLVRTLEEVGPDGVKITFYPPDLATVLSEVGGAPVLPPNLIDAFNNVIDEFGTGALAVPVPADLLGSGPYAVVEHEPGRTLRLEKRRNHWAEFHPTRVGLDNFESIAVEVYGIATAMLEAVKAGSCEAVILERGTGAIVGFRSLENAPAARDGHLVLTAHDLPISAQPYLPVARWRHIEVPEETPIFGPKPRSWWTEEVD